MSSLWKWTVCAIGAGALLSGSAAAAEYRVTFLGTITEGTDATGVFGAPSSLTGEDFAAIYTYNTPGGFRDTVPGVSDLLEPITASLRIRGVTYEFPDTDIIESFVLAQPGMLSFRYLTVVDADPVDIQNISTRAFSPALGPSLDLVPGNYIADGDGHFGIDICCCPSCGDSFEDVFAGGRFDVDLVRVAVPEPATWAVMILGFGFAGASLRRRRAATA